MKKHWEKTVEYCYLWNAIQKDRVDFAMPLSGKHERGAGDAVFGHCEKLVLIEFKSDESQLNSEMKKFDDYALAERQLKDRDGHHFLVYGEVVNGGLGLREVRYFSRESLTEHSLSQGLGRDPFDAYLKEFLEFRKRDERGGARSALPEFANVMGVSAEGKLLTVATLLDYVTEASPFLADAFDHEPASEPANAPRMR